MQAIDRLLLVAWRGLWDKFAAPQTPGAVRRAYLRGVPSIVRPNAAFSIAHAIAIAADASVNTTRQPLFLVSGHLQTLDGTEGASRADVFCIVAGREDVAWPVWRWTGFQWTPAGSYLTARASRDLPVDTLGRVAAGADVVLFESANIAGTQDERRRALTGRTDEDIAAVLHGAAAAGAMVARVSDMVEADQLARLSREAA